MNGGRGGIAGALAVALLSACPRTSSTDRREGDAPLAVDDAPPPEIAQASRLLLGGLNPQLLPYASTLGEHFGGQGDEPLAVQRSELPGGRVAFLVSHLDESGPLLVVVDGRRALWSSPLGATSAAPGPLAPYALVPAAAGLVVVGFERASHTLWARRWGDDGRVTAETAVGSFESCDALTAIYSRGVDWLVACASPAGARAQLVRENGETPWGRAGAAVGEATAPGAVSLALLTPSTWALVQRVRRDTLFHVLAFRYDWQARPLWAAPADLGVPRRSPALERYEVRALAGATLRVEIPQGLRGGPAHAAEVGPDGVVHAVAP